MSLFWFPGILPDREDHWYTKPVLITILIFAAILRFSYLVELQANPMPQLVAQNENFDQYNYVTMANDIIAHHWLGSKHPGHSPVYSYFIATVYSIFGPDINFVFVVQILYGIFAVYLFYRCAILLFQNKNLGLLTAFVATMYSPFLFYEGELIRESMIAYTNLVAFFLLLQALRKEKYKNFILAGMALGLSFIIRAGVMPFFVLGFLLFAGGEWKTRCRWVGFVLLGMVIIIAPLTIRNHMSGFNALTETSGPTLFWLGNSYDSPGIGLTYTETQKTLTAETQGKILKTLEVLWREIRKHPQEYKAIFLRKLQMLFNGYEIPANLSYDLFKTNSLFLKLAIFNFTWVSPLALLGLVLCFRKYKDIGLLYIFIFSLTIFVFIFHIQGRYRIAFVPFYIIAASYTLFWLWQMIRKKALTPLVGAIILLLPLFLFTWPARGVMERYFDGGVRAGDYVNMGVAYLMRIEEHPQKKKVYLEKAIVYYDKALSLLQDSRKIDIYITEAMVYRELHMNVHAFDCLRRVLTIDPDNEIAKKEYSRLAAEAL